MHIKRFGVGHLGSSALLAVLASLVPLVAVAQDRLPTMPGYDRYQKMSRELPQSVKLASLNATWKDEGKAFEYAHDGKLYRFDIAEGKAKVIGDAPQGRGFGFGGRSGRRPEGAGGGDSPPAIPPGSGQAGQPPGGLPPGSQPPGGPPGGRGPARGRQAGTTISPDGKLKATYRERNLWLSDASGENESAITTDGNDKNRIKSGTGCWVYGEELFQRTAMWWSPDSKMLAYYRFDESRVPDYFLPLNQANLQSRMDIEAYPKAGAPNPTVDVFIYNLDTKQTTQVDVRDGQPFEDGVIGHYVYRVAWSPDGKELLFLRTNRRQNILELAACDPATGKCRVVVRDEWPASWVENLPTTDFLKDGRRFIWTSERTGWKNFYLGDLDGSPLTALTNHPFEVGRIVRVDEAAGLLYYLARSGDNPMKMQLHRIGLDGQNDQRLTDPRYHHTVNLAPDGQHLIDTIQAHDSPPETRLLDANGQVVAELAKSDLTRFEELGFKRVELFQYKAADGTTDLDGLLHFPSNFDPNQRYPLLVSVYAGPATNGARETFTLPSALTELGFLVASLDSRSADGRGKHFLDAIYLKLGVTEIDDQAAGVKALRQRPYVDASRVGIYGTSYGGYASILCLLRHPDVFQAACASSPVTDYRLYDSIYTERYLWLPGENKSGYDEGSALVHANKLKGRLMIYYGTADNNVHPSNSLQLIRALQRAGKNFEVQVGPDAGHSSISQPRMLEFFVENLIQRPSAAPAAAAAQ